MKKSVRKFVATAVVTGVGAIGTLAASPAYANVYQTGCPATFQISGPGKNTQCFNWDDSLDGNANVLQVNDWYTQIYEYHDYSCARWRDITTGDIVDDTIYAGATDYRPGPNYYLVYVAYLC